jgi:hypothetical protein
MKNPKIKIEVIRKFPVELKSKGYAIAATSHLEFNPLGSLARELYGFEIDEIIKNSVEKMPQNGINPIIELSPALLLVERSKDPIRVRFLSRELVRTADQLLVKHLVIDSFRMLSTELRVHILLPIMKAFVEVETKYLEKIYIFVEDKNFKIAVHTLAEIYQKIDPNHYLRRSYYEEERNWLKELMAINNNRQFEWFSDFGIKSAYAHAYRTNEGPEPDDEHFIESLIQGLIEAEKDSNHLSWNTDFIHLCFEIIAFRMNRVKAAAKLRERLLSGHAAAQLELSIAAWECKDDTEQKQLIRSHFFERYGDLTPRNLSKSLINRWPSRSSGKMPHPEDTVTRFIEDLHSENKKLDWWEFLDRLAPSKLDQSKTLLNHLLALSIKPSIFWYPGSSSDIQPIFSEPRNNPLSRRFLRIDNSASLQDPILFWMNDLHDISKGIEKPNQDWEEILKKREDYIFDGHLPVTLFSVRKNGAEYLVVFSNIPSHVLFAEVIFPARLNVACTLLAAQGGFSGQLFGFEQYRDIPKILSLTESELGPVDVYFLDAYAHDKVLRRPNSPYIRRYEYQAQNRLPCGWQPCRAFIRPGLSFQSDDFPKYFYRSDD